MQYCLPTKIIIGKIEEELRKEVDLFKPQQILLVSGQTMKKLGVVDKVLGLLSGYEVFVFSEVGQKPGPELVARVKREANVVIGLGGGSVLDTAKAVAFELKKPYIAIPTTAGTGSEVSPFVALYDMAKKKKLSLTPGFPATAIIDYRLTLTLPKEQVAATGLDALSQAIEAYWSIYSSPLTDTHAEKAIKLVMANLKDSWDGKEKAREAMCLAALESGLAFSQTKTAAVHSVSYPLSVHYDVAHGFACALTLPYFFPYNWMVKEDDCLDKRGVEFVQRRMEELSELLGAKSPVAAKDKILDLMKSIGAPTQLAFDPDLVIREGFSPERVANNPRKLTEQGLKEILDIIKVKEGIL